jgi:hypothetical protein
MLITFLLTLSLHHAQAQVDAASKKAQQQTQDLLKNRDEREKTSKSDPKAQKAIQDVKNLTGGDQKSEDDIYSLAADLMPVLVEKSNGDPNKMMKILEDAQKDPEAFAKSWTPEQRRKLQQISEKLKAAQQKR